jgi:Ser-tRNA(Ala) deacylase AlaX
MEQQIQLNDHNKQEYPPMHTVEHILNATMVKTFGCPRSRNAHIERKKSKCDYELANCPSEEQIQAIEDKVNEVIRQHLPVTIEFMPKQEAKDIVDLSKLPEDASETLRIVRIGDYDTCACIGLHVENTSEIRTFKIISYDYDEEQKVLRMRFKLIER